VLGRVAQEPGVQGHAPPLGIGGAQEAYVSHSLGYIEWRLQRGLEVREVSIL
jgi:hypothetical protein